jgi:SAM-dependent methyltransferase
VLDVRWLEGLDVSATCPLCSDSGPKSGVLEMGGPVAGTLVACPACSLRFFPGLVPASYAGARESAALRGFELTLGLHGSIECLGRIDLARVRRFLEVGCGTGYTLDFARHAYGWDVLGVDDSAWSRAAGAELGLPMVDGLLGYAGAVPERSWDLVFACEVLEHVPDPGAFLGAVRRATTDSGIFLLRTPNAERVRPERDRTTLAAMLSPGFHTMLHTPVSLERALREAGFTEARVLALDDTLHAAASDSSLHWDPAGTLDPADVAAYVRDRPQTLPVDGAARLGLLQRHANRVVADGDATTAREALAELDGAFRSRYGVGLEPGAGPPPEGSEELYCHALSTVGHAALLDGDRSRAAEAFAAAARAAESAGPSTLGSPEAVDLGLELAARHARIEAIVLEPDPDRAATRLSELLARAGDARRDVALGVFVCSVGAGSLALADRVVAEAARALAAPGPETGSNPIEREARWSLAMLDLHHRSDPGSAAAGFARLAADPEFEAPRRWSARFHEGYARWHAGERTLAAEILSDIVTAAAGPEPPPAEFVEHARALLAQR